METNLNKTNKFKKFILNPLGIGLFILFIIIVYTLGFVLFAACVDLMIKEKPIGHQIITPKDPTDQEYMRKLKTKLKAHWFPDKKNFNVRIVVFFRVAKNGQLLYSKIQEQMYHPRTPQIVAKNGQLLYSKIQESSNDPIQDSLAIEAVKNAAPFEPLSKKYKGKSADIQFTFDYRMF